MQSIVYGVLICINLVSSLLSCLWSWICAFKFSFEQLTHVVNIPCISKVVAIDPRDERQHEPRDP